MFCFQQGSYEELSKKKLIFLEILEWAYDDFSVHIFIQILNIGRWNESQHHLIKFDYFSEVLDFIILKKSDN